MKIVDEQLLDEFRAKRRCEFCGCALYGKPHPHHIHSRGAGRLDVRMNLISLGSYLDCDCHGRAHDGKIKRVDLIDVVAKREGVETWQVVQEIYRLRRLDKSGKEVQRKGA